MQVLEKSFEGERADKPVHDFCLECLSIRMDYLRSDETMDEFLSH